MILSLSILMIAALPQTQPVSVKDMVATEKEAFLLLPPKAVAADVESAVWSSDSKSIAFITADRTDETKAIVDLLNGTAQGEAPVLGRQRIGTWAAQTERVRWMPDLPANCHPTQIDWCPGDQALIAKVVYFDPQSPSKQNVGQAVISARIGAARWSELGVSHAETEPVNYEIFANPAINLFLVLADNMTTRKAEVMQIDRNGNLVAPHETLRRAISDRWRPYENVKGGTLFLHFSPGAPERPRILTKDFTFETAGKLEMQAAQQTAKFFLENGPGPVAEILYLRPHGSKTPAMTYVCQHVEWSGLSPNEVNVGYTSQRMLWVRTLQPISLEAYAAALAAANRTEAMSRAKQVATALQIYLADNEDMWDGGDPLTLLEPYTKNRALFDGFVFTIPQGDFMKLERPAETEIGHIPMSGGRIVAYADGHVKWVADPQ